jgi:putative membrane protein
MKAKQFFSDFLKGASMGLGMIPGVSAGTMAVLVGIYDRLIDAIAGVRKHFKESVRSVWVLLLGAVISSVIFVLGVYFGYDYAPFAITCLFAGVILGSCPIVTKELKGEKMNAKGILLIGAGLVVAAGIGVLSVCGKLYWNVDLNDDFMKGTWWVYLLVLLVGFVAAIACVIPGISGAMILYIFGLYAPTVAIYISKKDSSGNILIPSMFQDHSRIASGIGLTLCLLVGALAGLVLVSKAMKKLLAERRVPTFEVVLGFILGSIVSMFVNQNVIKDDNTWVYQHTSVTEYIIGVVLFVLATVGFFFLTTHSAKNTDSSK